MFDNSYELKLSPYYFAQIGKTCFSPISVFAMVNAVVIHSANIDSF